MKTQNFLVTLVVNMLAIAITVWLLPGLTIAGNNILSLIIIALVFGFVNAIVRPILTILSLPFIVLTLGLFIFILNGLMLLITAALTPLNIAGFWWAVLGAVVLGIVNMLLKGFVPDEKNA